MRSGTEVRRFDDRARKFKITKINNMLHKGAYHGNRENIVDARRALQRGEGAWTDRHGRQHELSGKGYSYFTEKVHNSEVSK